MASELGVLGLRFFKEECVGFVKWRESGHGGLSGSLPVGLRRRWQLRE